MGSDGVCWGLMGPDGEGGWLFLAKMQNGTRKSESSWCHFSLITACHLSIIVFGQSGNPSRS